MIATFARGTDVEYKLREYQVRPGELDEWLVEWRAQVSTRCA